MRRRAHILSATAVLAILHGAPAAAIDLVVTRYDDPVPDGCVNNGCSLREAVVGANALATADRVLLSAGVYELTTPGTGEDDAATGDLDTYGDLEILGPGATMTTIDGNGLDRLFHFHDSAAPGTDVVRLAGVALTGGNTPDAEIGAAISAHLIELTIERCEIHGNTAPDSGFGTVYVNQFANLAMRETTVRDNPAGGVHLSQADGQLFNSTLSNNTGAELEVLNNGAVLCGHLTLRDDEAAPELVLFSASTLVQLSNSALIGNCVVNDGATLQTLGGNLESPGATCDLGAGDLENVATHGFGLLGDNGGPTRTHLPSLISPAVGNANSLFCAPADQRGVARTPETCEIGAVERATVRPPTPIFHDGFRQGSTAAWSETVAN